MTTDPVYNEQQEFRQLCLDKVGKCVALDFRDLQKITGYAPSTLYKFKDRGLLPSANRSGAPIFNYLSVWSLMSSL